jgi:hypothetical protein
MGFNKKQVENFFERTDFDIEKGRKTMDALRSRSNRIKNLIKKLDGADYQAVDEIHINTIVMCEEIQMRALGDILENGTLVYADAAQTIKQKNHSVSTFFQMTKLINDTSKKLGLSALDRKELNLQPEIEDDMPDD